MTEPTPKSGAPTRTRAARTTTKAAPKAPAATAKPKTSATAPVNVPAGKFTVELEYVSDTASYAKFQFPPSMKGTVAGNVYAPHGTKAIKVLFITETEDEAPAAE